MYRVVQKSDTPLGRLKMRDWNYRHHITGGGKCGTKELWNAKAPCCSGSEKIICPIICWTYQCCNCVFQYYDSVSDCLDPYGYEMCVNLISFYGMYNMLRAAVSEAKHTKHTDVYGTYNAVKTRPINRYSHTRAYSYVLSLV